MFRSGLVLVSFRFSLSGPVWCLFRSSSLCPVQSCLASQPDSPDGQLAGLPGASSEDLPKNALFVCKSFFDDFGSFWAEVGLKSVKIGLSVKILYRNMY